MPDFTPFSALAGGVMIGLASVFLLALDGRIAGVSGILHDLFRPPGRDIGWHTGFLAGLLIAGFIYLAVAPPLPATSPTIASLVRVAVAGLLVGFGTRMANGCTSGHGVCGLGRLSPRSLIAVLVFVSAGIVTTSVVRHVFGVPS
jgi:uncharacterized protein